MSILCAVSASEFLNTNEAAEFLGVDPQTVRRWAGERKIRHVRLPSGQLRFTRADVEAVLAPVEPEPASGVAK
jgi:excisionase family DNA binding protein